MILTVILIILVGDLICYIINSAGLPQSPISIRVILNILIKIIVIGLVLFIGKGIL